MGEVVRWGVMGNATIARVCVIPAMQKSKNGILQALATHFPVRARPLAAEHSIPRVYDSYHALLDDETIDAVYIPLPNHLHHGWTIKALQAGKHVLCEKPLACNAGQAQEMAEAASDCDKLLMEAFMYRFHPRSLRVKEMADIGSIGRLRLIRSAFCYAMEEELLNDDRNPRLRPEMGGGALLDVGCYGVSLARWLYAAEPTRLQAQAVYHSGGADVQLVGSLRFADGRLATIEAGFVSALQQTYSIVGADGVVELPHDAFIPWEKDTVVIVRGKDEEQGRKEVVSGADEYQLMVEHFADAVLGKTDLRFAPADSVANMKVLDALAAAARNGGTVGLREADE